MYGVHLQASKFLFDRLIRIRVKSKENDWLYLRRVRGSIAYCMLCCDLNADVIIAAWCPLTKDRMWKVVVDVPLHIAKCLKERWCGWESNLGPLCCPVLYCTTPMHSLQLSGRAVQSVLPDIIATYYTSLPSDHIKA